MRDACEITRPGGRTFDPNTGQYTDDPPTVVYTGVCRFKPEFSGFESAAGEQEIQLRRYTVAIPWETPSEVLVGDTVRATTSDDPWLTTDRTLQVVSIGYGTDRAARRLIAEDIAGAQDA